MSVHWLNLATLEGGWVSREQRGTWSLLTPWRSLKEEVPEINKCFLSVFGKRRREVARLWLPIINPSAESTGWRKQLATEACGPRQRDTENPSQTLFILCRPTGPKSKAFSLLVSPALEVQVRWLCRQRGAYHSWYHVSQAHFGENNPHLRLTPLQHK